MKIEQGKSVVKLTKQELLDAVWLLVKTEQGVELAEFDIEVDGVSLFPEKSAELQSSNTETEPDENGWYSVPKDWEREYCPNPSVRSNSTVEVVYRCSATANIKCSELLTSWIQEDDPWDVVKYRVIEA